MKKTILKSLLLGAAALTAMTASAENKLIIEDFSIAPGETKEVAVYLQHDQAFNAFQFDLEDVKGLVFEYAVHPDDAEIGSFELDDHWPKRKNGNPCLVTYSDNAAESLADPNLLFGVVLKNEQTYANSGADKYVVPFMPGQGIICILGITATNEFEGGQLICHYAKGDYSDPAKPEWNGNFTIENQEICNVTLDGAVEGTALADIVASGVDNTEYTVADDLAVVAKTAGGAFVTDGKDNWMKVVGVELAMDDIKGGTLKGVLSTVNGNQQLTVEAAPEAGDKVVTYEKEAWNLDPGSDPNDPHYIFAPKPNSVIKLTGYWWPTDQRLHGWTTGGQNVDVNFDWCAEAPELPEYTLLKDIESVVQLKAAWSGSKAAPTDEDACENYTIYPTSISSTQIVTGVENVKGSKDVVSVQYVNVAGQVANTPFEGVNMVVTRYADGSTVTTKVIK